MAGRRKASRVDGDNGRFCAASGKRIIINLRTSSTMKLVRLNRSSMTSRPTFGAYGSVVAVPAWPYCWTVYRYRMVIGREGKRRAKVDLFREQ